jgi:transposase
MQIVEREVGDVARLVGMIDREDRADRRDRFRMVLLALRGHEKREIAGLLGVAKSTVEHWAYAYRDGGLDALAGKPRPGGTPKIRGEHAQRLKQRIDAGPRESDGVCTLRGKDIQRIAKEELGVDVGLSSVYRALERMGYSCLAPRPRHEKQDPAAQEKFTKVSAPLL